MSNNGWVCIVQLYGSIVLHSRLKARIWDCLLTESQEYQDLKSPNEGRFGFKKNKFYLSGSQALTPPLLPVMQLHQAP